MVNFIKTSTHTESSSLYNIVWCYYDTENKTKSLGAHHDFANLLNKRPEHSKTNWEKISDKWYLILLIDKDSKPEDIAEATFAAAQSNKLKDFAVYAFDMPSEWLQKFHLRILLKNYNFNKYMSKTHPVKQKEFLIENLNIITNSVFDVEENNHLASCIHWSRDLSNEPSNVCTPEWFANNIVSNLENLPIEIEVLDSKEIEDIGMNALIGVAKGSYNKPKVVIMKYLQDNSAPTVLLGKGVCFDSGGISIKPASNMGDMKADMSGASVVCASLKALALNQVKTNVIGIVGLVENMPGGNAQKPGDVVKTLSGQTVEISNTDAEGRLVLCDLMWYAQERFKPKCLVDYATLTGAIVVALGSKYAGLFSNNDELANSLLHAGIASDDLLWRMPLCDEFNKIIDSKIADIDNSGNREASSCTAAHFIGRFCNNYPWAHLDIAGTAFSSKPSDKSPAVGATGFGVHLTYKWLK